MFLVLSAWSGGFCTLQYFFMPLTASKFSFLEVLWSLVDDVMFPIYGKQTNIYCLTGVYTYYWTTILKRTRLTLALNLMVMDSTKTRSTRTLDSNLKANYSLAIVLHRAFGAHRSFSYLIIEVSLRTWILLSAPLLDGSVINEVNSFPIANNLLSNFSW